MRMGVYPQSAEVWEAPGTCREKFSEHLHPELAQTQPFSPLHTSINASLLSGSVVTGGLISVEVQAAYCDVVGVARV